MLADRFRVWKTAYNTANLPVGMTTPPDAVSKWLVITRAAVFSMTVTSGLIGGLLAVGAERLAQIGGGAVGTGFSVNYALLALAVVGLVVAHAANNMINDYFDLEGGVDTEDYVRAQYDPTRSSRAGSPSASSVPRSSSRTPSTSRSCCS